MPTEVSASIDLDRPEVIEFASSTEPSLTDPDLTDKQAQIVSDGFRATGKTRPGPAKDLVDTVPIDPKTGTNGVVGITYAEILTYDLVDIPDDEIRSQVETQIIHCQPVEFFIWHELFVADDATKEEEAKIISAFEEYVDGPDVNPNDFASESGIAADSYEAISYFELRKIGPKQSDQSQDDEMNGYYQNSETQKLVLRSARRVEEVLERDDGSFEVADPENAQPIKGIISEIIESSPAMVCEGVTHTQRRVGTLIQYPEFKIRWRRVRIKVGCVRISIKVPQLMTRTAKRVLYAVLAHEVHLDRIVLRILLHCLQKAATSASIAGLATANIKIAAVAFKAVFSECVNEQLLGYVRCLLPELILLKEAGGWRPM